MKKGDKMTVRSYYFVPTYNGALEALKRVPNNKGQWKFIKKHIDGYVVGIQKIKPQATNVKYAKMVE